MTDEELCPSVNELSAIRASDHAAFAELLTRWTPDIEGIARKSAPRHCDREDYVQIGRMTLHQVCLRFADGIVTNFVRYARRAVRRAMIKQARADLGKGRSAVTYVSPDELSGWAAARQEPVEALLAEERRATVRRWWDQVGGRDHVLLDLLYDFGQGLLTGEFLPDFRRHRRGWTGSCLR